MIDSTWLEQHGILILNNLNDAVGLQMASARSHNTYRYSLFTDGEQKALLCTYVFKNEMHINVHPILSPFDAYCLGLVDRVGFKILVREALQENI